MENYLEDALSWAKTNKPNASLHHKSAFANSVAYLVTGASGGYGGPSLREHLCSWSLSGLNGRNEGIIQFPDGTLPPAGNWGFEEAIKFCEALCFEPAAIHREKLLQIMEVEHCFDDDPLDLEVLRGK
jgi:hypothetical protein